MSNCMLCIGFDVTTGPSVFCGVEGFPIFENSTHVSQLVAWKKMSFDMEGQNADCRATIKHFAYPEWSLCRAERTSGFPELK